MGSSEDILIDKLEQKVKEQAQYIEQIAEAPLRYGVVVAVDPKTGRVVYSSSGTLFEKKAKEFVNKLSVGDNVKVHPNSGGIVDYSPCDLSVGVIVRVVKRVSQTLCEIGGDLGKRACIVSAKMKLEEGDRVIVDPSVTVILFNLGQPPEGFTAEACSPVKWEDIGGLEEAKRQLREAVELPRAHPEIFERYGRRPPKGILLYGPPGCGKTLLAKATYTSLAALSGKKEASTGFIYVKGPEILNKYVGEAELAIRRLFTRARDHYAKKGYPALIFIDEADAILSRRGSGISSDMEKTIVPQFLSEMDGLISEGAPTVLLASNRPDSLDPAVVRDGRMDCKIRIERPSKVDVQQIFKINLKNRPVQEQDLDAYGADELFDENKVVYLIRDHKGIERKMTLANMVNGAMVAGIVERGISLAMRREFSGGTKGITKEDICAATKEHLTQLKDLDTSDELAEFTQGMKISSAVKVV